MPLRHGIISAKIRPDIKLKEIVITLSDREPAKIEMRGAFVVGRRSVDHAGAPHLETSHFGPAARAFISEIVRDYTTSVDKRIEKEKEIE